MNQVRIVELFYRQLVSHFNVKPERTVKEERKLLSNVKMYRTLSIGKDYDAEECRLLGCYAVWLL
jgi:hypothetical protein